MKGCGARSCGMQDLVMTSWGSRKKEFRDDACERKRERAEKKQLVCPHILSSPPALSQDGGNGKGIGVSGVP